MNWLVNAVGCGFCPVGTGRFVRGGDGFCAPRAFAISMAAMNGPTVRFLGACLIGVLSFGSAAVAAEDEVKLEHLDAWRPVKGWSEVGAVKLDAGDAKRLVATPGTGVLLSAGVKVPYLLAKEPHGDAEIHVEFVIPAQSNSGVYVMGCYEVQIYDSHGVEKDKYPGIECGGIYPEWVRNANVRGHSPMVNAALPAGEWQSFDIVFRAPKFDEKGKKTANARFEKVVHNGKVVHENVELSGPTRGGGKEAATGVLQLQGDHGVVAYRNVRIKALGK